MRNSQLESVYDGVIRRVDDGLENLRRIARAAETIASKIHMIELATRKIVHDSIESEVDLKLWRNEWKRQNDRQNEQHGYLRALVERAIEQSHREVA
jgi:hypothetical protein